MIKKLVMSLLIAALVCMVPLSAFADSEEVVSSEQVVNSKEAVNSIQAVDSEVVTTSTQAADSEVVTTSEQVVEPMAIASTYELENVTKISSGVGYGSWRTGPKATGSTGGTISKSISDSFGLSISTTINATSNEFSSAFGFSISYSKNFTSTCSANVPAGTTVQIYYRGLYDVYTADQVLYQVGPGVPYHEVSRKSVKVYKPVDMEFKW